MNRDLPCVSRWLGVLLVAALAVRADERRSEVVVKDAQGIVTRQLAECDDPEERATMERMIFALFPEEMRRAQTVFPRNRDEAEEIVNRVVDQCWELMELKERNPERYESEMKLRQLNNQTAELARQAVAANGAQREALLKQLKAKLEAYFDLKQAQMKQEAEELRAHLDELENQIQRRAKGRDAMVDRRIRQLLDGELEW